MCRDRWCTRWCFLTPRAGWVLARERCQMLLKVFVSMIREIFCRLNCPLQNLPERLSSVRTSNSKDSLYSNLCLDLWTLRASRSQDPVATAHLWLSAQPATCASNGWLIRSTSHIKPSCQAALCCGCTASIVYSSVTDCKYCLLISWSQCFGDTWHFHLFHCRRWLRTWTARVMCGPCSWIPSVTASYEWSYWWQLPPSPSWCQQYRHPSLAWIWHQVWRWFHILLFHSQ